ncbi:hypothetical protein Bbelb_240950 [Branchiostoma belcheri]|nr:hypothetical protein Bbelb_240950 [Branchiostoma belcheri]
MYEQAEPVRTLKPGSDREQDNRLRAPYSDPPDRRGNTSGHVGCDVKVYEQAEPVRTSQAGSDGEQNNRPRAPYPDPPARRGNTSGHGKHAPHAYYKGQETSSNVYEEAEAVKLENISGDVPHGTETSTDTDTAQPDGARVRVKGRRVRHIAAGLAVIATLVTVGVILLVFLNHGTYNYEKTRKISRNLTIGFPPITMIDSTSGHGSGQSGCVPFCARSGTVWDGHSLEHITGRPVAGVASCRDVTRPGSREEKWRTRWSALLQAAD